MHVLYGSVEGKKKKRYAITLRRHAGALPAALCGVRHENETQKGWKEEKFIFWFQLEAVSNVTKAPVNKFEISSWYEAHFHAGIRHKHARRTSRTIYSHRPLTLAFPHLREWKVRVAKHSRQPTDALSVSTFTPIRSHLRSPRVTLWLPSAISGETKPCLCCLGWGAGGRRPARAADQSVACFLTDIRGSTTRSRPEWTQRRDGHRQKHQINSSQTNPENPAALTDWHLSCLFTLWLSPPFPFFIYFFSVNISEELFDL